MMGLWEFPLYRRVAVLLNPHVGTSDDMSIEDEAQSTVLLCLGARVCPRVARVWVAVDFWA